MGRKQARMRMRAGRHGVLLALGVTGRLHVSGRGRRGCLG